MIDLDTFVYLSDNQIAQLLGECGQKVCVFPISGTRRWYTMQYGKHLNGRATQHYIDESIKRLLDLYRMFFSHGIHTLLSPLHGLLEDEQETLASRMHWLEILTTHSDFLSFYKEFGVRVYFYGDYRRKLAETPYAYLPGQFERLSKYTQKNKTHRLFYGMFPENAAENIADLSVRHFIRAGQIPDRKMMSKLYYGETIESADLFIGFGAFNPSDYPLLDFKGENLYFTAVPSFYLEKDQLRRILHDHLHPRQELDDSQLSESELAALKDFYHAQRNATLGLGSLRPGACVSSRHT